MAVLPSVFICGGALMRQTTRTARKNARARERHYKEAGDRLALAAMLDANTLLKKLKTARDGLNEAQIRTSRDLFGSNVITRGKKQSLFSRLVGAFINPFNVILFVIGPSPLHLCRCRRRR